jgi:hypothetical protein
MITRYHVYPQEAYICDDGEFCLFSNVTELQQSHEQVLAEKDRKIEAAEEALREICIIAGGFNPCDGEGTSPNTVIEIVDAKLATLTAQNDALWSAMEIAHERTSGMIRGFIGRRIDEIKALARVAQPEEQANAQQHYAVTVATLTAQNEWQPIDSAPRDGVFLGILDVPKGCCPMRVFHSVNGFITILGESYSIRRSPTHWMPLPELPTHAQPEKDENL